MQANMCKLISRGKKVLSFIRPKFQPEALSNPFNVGMSVPSDLIGRDLVSFAFFSTQDIYSILWTALDIKNRDNIGKICDGKRISIISSNPVRRISLCNAGTKLGAFSAFLNPSELDMNSLDFEMFGKTLGSSSDMVVVDSNDISHQHLEEFASGCNVPVISTESSQLCPLYCLSELMTLFEHYGYLRRLAISYFGDASDPLLNTYSLLLPKVGMHLHYFANGDIESKVWNKGVELSAQYNTEFKQFDNLADNLYRTHVLSIAPNQMDISEIVLKDIKEMNLDWTVLHKDLHKKSSFLSKDLLRCEQSLIWKNLLNQQWIFMASIIAFTRKFSPTIARPQFEGGP